MSEWYTSLLPEWLIWENIKKYRVFWSNKQNGWQYFALKTKMANQILLKTFSESHIATTNIFAEFRDDLGLLSMPAPLKTEK
jgi:hypothetical protein